MRPHHLLPLPLMAALIAGVMTASGCSGGGPDGELAEPQGPAVTADAPAPEPASTIGLGTPFVLQASATAESLAQVRAEVVHEDGSRTAVYATSFSFEIRSDGQAAAIDRVRVVLQPLPSDAAPVAIRNHEPSVLSILDSSPDYVRATAGLDWSVEPSADQPRYGAEAVPVHVGLEAKADGSHVRLTMSLDSPAELALGRVKLSTGPWVVRLEGDLKPR